MSFVITILLTPTRWCSADDNQPHGHHNGGHTRPHIWSAHHAVHYGSQVGRRYIQWSKPLFFYASCYNVCMYVYSYVSMSICVYQCVSMFVHMCPCLSPCVHVCPHVSICVHVCLCVSMSVHMCSWWPCVSTCLYCVPSSCLGSIRHPYWAEQHTSLAVGALTTHRRNFSHVRLIPIQSCFVPHR